MRKLGASIAAFTLAMANWVDCTPAILRAADPPAILPYVLSGDHYPYYLLADPNGIPTASRTDQGRSMFDWSNGCGGYRGYCPAPAAASDVNADYEGCPEGDDSATSSDEEITAQTDNQNSYSDDSDYNADWSPEYAPPADSDVVNDESDDETDWSSDEESLYGEDSIDEGAGEADARFVADYEEDSELTDGATNADTDVPPPVADASIYDEDFYGEANTAETAPAANETAADSDFYGDEYGDYEGVAPAAPAVTEAADVDADYEGYGDEYGDYEGVAPAAPAATEAADVDADYEGYGDEYGDYEDVAPAAPAVTEAADVDADYQGYGDYSADYDGSEYYGSEYDAEAELAPIDETSPTADVEAGEDANLASVVDAWPSLPSPVKSVIMAMVKLTGGVRVVKAPGSIR